MNNNLYYYLAFSHCLGIGPIKFNLLKNHFGTAKKAYEASVDKLKNLLGQALTEKFIAFRQKFDPAKKLEELKQKQIAVLSCDDEKYPSQLKNISDPPICLYVKGNLSGIDFINSQFIAVVGTRKPTSYGQQITKKFAYELSLTGFIIVSGMAIGIDTIAHQATLEADGKTIAVLGCGVDIIYPQSNQILYQKIIEKSGLIISEFPPGHTVLRGLFVARNRLISGLSRGVLVVEGAKDSGALITARYAANQGKEVFAPPGPLTSEMSAAPNLLLKQGAKFVTSVEDILEEFNLRVMPKKQQELEINLTGNEKIIFDLVMIEPRLIDELIELSHQSVDLVLNSLSLLEIKGIVEKNSEGKYQIKVL